MKQSKNLPAITLLMFFAANCTAEDATVVFSEDFSRAGGFVSANTNGEYSDKNEPRLQSAHVYMSSTVSGGDFQISVTEDDKTHGADGKPGVLSLSMITIPASAEYSGFVYEGRMGDEISVSTLKSAESEKQLEQVTVRFHYRSINAVNPRKAGATYNCRFEIDVDDSYETRVDFGSLTGTNEWQTFESKLSEGTNASKFLAQMKEASTPTFKIVWGQEGEISNYDPGDVLLIDDISVSVLK